MKRIKLFLIISFLTFITNITKAQTFFGDGQKYIFITYDKNGSGSQYHSYGSNTEVVHLDSIVSDTEFYNIESEIDRKYYLKYSNNQIYIKGASSFYSDDKNYFLLYDFNLTAGDSFKGKLPFNDSEMKLRIDSVGQIEMGGKSRKIQYVSGRNGYQLADHFAFIEGIGGLEAFMDGGFAPGGGIQHFLGFFGEWGYYFTAACYNDTLLYWNDNYMNTYFKGGPTCDFSQLKWITSLEDEIINNGLKIYPNPAQDILNIEFRQTKPFQSEIINSLGQIVKMGVSNPAGNSTIDISHLQKGIYFLKIKNDNAFHLQKIIKE